MLTRTWWIRSFERDRYGGVSLMVMRGVKEDGVEESLGEVRVIISLTDDVLAVVQAELGRFKLSAVSDADRTMVKSFVQWARNSAIVPTEGK